MTVYYKVFDEEGNFSHFSKFPTKKGDEPYASDHPEVITERKRSIKDTLNPDENLFTHREKRGPEYPNHKDQLDYIMKGFKYLYDQGIDVGPDIKEWLNKCLAVKEKYPKE